MAWVELINKRGRCSRTYRDSANEHKRFLYCGQTALHRSDGSPIDMRPQRVNNAALDGWTITANDWHYALGKPTGLSDGWVGFGGRSGTRWFKFRLARVGYLHWPDRTWQDVGGAPTYDRATLQYESRPFLVGPNNETIYPTAIARWKKIWSLGAGTIDQSWRVDGDRLKEEVIISAAARAWITANRKPTTALDTTYFGFVFQIDYIDVPRILRGGTLLTSRDDFDDDGGIELRDATDALLAFMPLDYVSAGGTAIPLRKRFYQEGLSSFLLIGARCDALAQLPAGDLIFDPSLNVSVGAGGDDGHWGTWYGGNTFNSSSTELMAGAQSDAWTLAHIFARFTNVTISAGSTIDSACLRLTNRYGETETSCVFRIYGVDEDSPAAPTTYAGANGATLTTAYVGWTPGAWSSDTAYDSPSLTTIIQEIVDRAGWASGNAMMLQVRDNGTPSGHYKMPYSYDGSSAYAPQLRMTYTESAGGGQPTVLRSLGIPGMNRLWPLLRR